MKGIFIFILLVAMLFLSEALADEEPAELGRLPEDINAQREQISELIKRIESRRAAKLDGREVLVRIYDNWETNLAEFEGVHVQLDGSEVVLDSYDIADNAFVVLIREDQDDEVVRELMSGYFLYAESYTQGLRFKLPRSGSLSYELTFKNARGSPLSRANVKIFLYSEDSGKESRILLREVELDESGVFKPPSVNGSLNRSYLIITHPDNDGVIVADLEEMGFYRRFGRISSLTVRVPWVSQETDFYKDSMWCIVVDDANHPISSALVASDLVKSSGLKFLTDEQGRFSLYVPRQKEDMYPKRKYKLRVDAPTDFGFEPFVGVLPDKAEYVIRMADYGYSHTFVFEDEEGTIVDPERLQRISVEVQQAGKPKLEYKYKDLKNGGYFLLGTYKAKMSGVREDFVFEPMEVTEGSPEKLVFTIDKAITYCGRVIHGVTGEPIRGAFVLGMKYSNLLQSVEKNLADITSEEWEQLHELKGNFDDGLLREIFYYEKMVRADANGRFEISPGPGREFSSFLAFEKDYLGIKFRMQSSKPDPMWRVYVSTMPLFPAAKVMVEPLTEKENVWVAPAWVIDVNDYPDWAGRPVKEESYEDVDWPDESYVADSNGIFDSEQAYLDIVPNPNIILLYILYDFITTDRISFFGIPVTIHRHYNFAWGGEPFEIDANDNAVWMDETFNVEPNENLIWLDKPFELPKEDPNRVPTFYEIFYRQQRYTTGPYFFIYDKASKYGQSLKPNRVYTFHVPAGLKLKLKIYAKDNIKQKFKWAPFTSSQAINLKQGEALDLGTGEVKLAPQVFVKVVDSAGKPVEGVPVQHWFEGYGVLLTNSTNKEGIAPFYTRYNQKNKFIVDSDDARPNLKEEMPYEIVSEEDKGREFTMTISDEMLDHLLK